jgi:hypothetical protein
MRSFLALVIVLLIGVDAQAGVLARLKARMGRGSCAAATSSCATATVADCSTPATTVAVPAQTIFHQGHTYQLVPVTGVKK